MTGNKIKDQPVLKTNLIRTINIKNETSTAAKEKINSDSTSGKPTQPIYSKSTRTRTKPIYTGLGALIFIFSI